MRGLLRWCVIAAGMLVSGCASTPTGPDLAISVGDVAYDSAAGNLEVTVQTRGAEGLAPIRVVVSDEAGVHKSAERLLEKPHGKTVRCALPWPRVAPNAKIRVAVSAKGRETDLSNNTVAVTMDEALRAGLEAFARVLNAVNSGRIGEYTVCVLEAEDFQVQKNVRIEKAKGANRGKAVRILDRQSRIEANVSLNAGSYFLYLAAMGRSPREDAVYVSLGRDRRRVVVRWNEWSLEPKYGFSVLKDGKHKVAITYAEPNVLVDRVIILRHK